MGGCFSSSSDDDQEARRKPIHSSGKGGGGRRARNDSRYRAIKDTTEESPRRAGQGVRELSELPGIHKVDLNLAGVRELSELPGISDRRAQGIVSYRNEHGYFHKIEDILKVSGIGQGVFNKIKDRVYLSHPGRSPRGRNKDHQFGLTEGNINNGYVPKAAHSRTLRVATWNLKCFGVSRASDRKTLEVVCLTILNSGFDLIAFQELADENVLQMICNELNAPKIQSVKRLHSHFHWSQSLSEKTGRMYQSLEYNGFLWNNSHSLELRSSGVLGGKPSANDRFVRRPFIGHFKVGNTHWSFIMVSVHLKATGLDGSDTPQVKHEISLLPTLMEALQNQGHSNILLVGDFNMDSSDESFNALRNHGFQNLIPSSIPTNISGHNLRGGHQYDNLWVTKRGVLPKHIGKYGIVREGLLINSIETVSDHCPVWADFSL